MALQKFTLKSWDFIGISSVDDRDPAILPLAVEANNALDVLLKGLDTVVAQAVAEAGAKVGHGGVLGALGCGQRFRVRGQHVSFVVGKQ